jgi:hypothetical protein
MGCARGIYGKQGRCIHDFMGRPDARNHLEDIVVDGRIILK